MSDLHEFFSLSGSRVDRQHIPNARGIEFVFEEVGFQGRSLFRFQAVVKCASRYRDGRVKTECFREILGIVQRELLTVKSPTAGWAFMTIPGLSPLTPAMNVPSMVVIKPSSSSWVFSPKYHTLPSVS